MKKIFWGLAVWGCTPSDSNAPWLAGWRWLAREFFLHRGKESSDDVLDSYSTGDYEIGFIVFYRFISRLISWPSNKITAAVMQSTAAEVPTTKTLQESVERVAKSPQGPKKLIATARNWVTWRMSVNEIWQLYTMEPIIQLWLLHVVSASIPSFFFSDLMINS